jgi:tetratricopeptide (TPR) repeat protein
LSLHHYRGEQWDGTWLYSVVAGRRAWEKFANVEAVQFYERALEASGFGAAVTPMDLAEVWEGLGDARMRLGEYELAGAAFQHAQDAFDAGTAEKARLMQKDAIALHRLTQFDQALARLTEAMELLDGDETVEAVRQRARLMSWCAAVLQRQKQPETVLEWCQRAIAEAERGGARDALAHAYFTLDWAYVSLNRPAEAVYSERAITIYEELGNLDLLAWVLNNLGGFRYLEGRWDEAIGLASRARDTFRKIGDDMNALIVALNIAEILSDQGRSEEADPIFHQAIELRRTGGIPLEIAEALSLLGRHEARVGNFAEAHAAFDESRDLYRDNDGDDFDLLTTEARRVECLVLEGRSAEALAGAAASLAIAEHLSGASVIVAALHRQRGWAFAQSGEMGAAESAFRASLKTANAGGENYGLISNDYEIALTLDALSRVERLAGIDSAARELDRDVILKRLNVVRLPEPPLD